MLPNANLYERKANINNISLISLMDDQVMQLKAQGEKFVTSIHSGMDENEKQQNINSLHKSRFVFKSRIYFTNTKL